MLYIVTFILVGLAIAGIAIKIIVKKDGEFAGTCASASPFLNKNNEPCGFVVNSQLKLNVKILN
jgi:hypothetical protein